MSGRGIVAAGVLAVVAASGLDGAPPAPAVKPPVATEVNAIVAAAAKLATIPADQRRYFRAVWCTSGEFKELQVVSRMTNEWSRGSAPYRLDAAGAGRLLVALIDLRQMAPGAADYDEVARLWEEFRFDPTFSVLYTPDTLRFLERLHLPAPKARKVKRTVKEWWPGGPDSAGKYYPAGHYDYEREVYADLVLRTVPEHFPLKEWQFIVDATGSQAPIVSSPYYLFRVTRTIQDDDRGKPTVASTLYGGLYYQLAGIRRSQKKGVSDLDLLLQDLGIGHDGETFVRLFRRVGADMRVAVRRSGVTGKARAVMLAYGPSGEVMLTFDLANKSIDVGQSPSMNLIEFVDRARYDAIEALWLRRNGTQGRAIFDGKGKLLDEAGQDVVADRTVPNPHPPILQPSRSCIACHDAEDGYRILRNDVAAKLGPGPAPRPDVYDDVSRVRLGQSRDEVLDRLRGLYQGDPERPGVGTRNEFLPRARRNYLAGILAACGPVPGEGAQTKIAASTAKIYLSIVDGYFYEAVTPQRALRDLWEEEADAKKAAARLKTLLPPVRLAVDTGEAAFSPEDDVVLDLEAGTAVNRPDWDLVRARAAARAAKTRALLKEKK